MWNTNVIKIGLIAVLGIAACGEEKSEDPAAQTAQPTIEESSSTKVLDLNLIGTFRSDSARPGDLTLLVLKTNGTFHSATLTECIVPPCNAVQEDGTYRISWRDSRKYITLFNVEGIAVDRYQYQWRDSSLDLLKVDPRSESIPTTRWVQMWVSTTAWCGSPEASAPTFSGPSDCQLQNLPIGPCAGEWTCVSNACNWDCSVSR